jgi:hypothetical protein
VLVDQLVTRITFICRRMADVVCAILEANRRTRRKKILQVENSFGNSPAASSHFSVEELVEFPHFLYAVKERFNVFVQKISEECAAKLRDEFYSTRLVYWEQVK